MSASAQRREEEKLRRRREILDAADALYLQKGWEALTVEQVARSARLSRALVYLYFRDKEDLLFAIGERALRLLCERFAAALASQSRGLDQVQAIARAYLGYAHEFPHYFDFLSRFHASAASAEPGSNESACHGAGDAAIGTVVLAIESGRKDGSIRPRPADVDRADVGASDSKTLAVTLWAFTHGVCQVVMARSRKLARIGISDGDFSAYAFGIMRMVIEGSP
jgi:AcrR family transcriptional regulator